MVRTPLEDRSLWAAATQTGASADLITLQREIYLKTHYGRRPARHLLPRLASRPNLIAAWHRVASSEGADTPGPDGRTCAQLAPRLGSLLDELADELVRGRYRHGPIRQFDTPKPDGSGTRTLALLNVRDRIVHAAIKQILEPVLEPRFDPRSYGFRPGRGVGRAAAAVCQALSRGSMDGARRLWVVQVDVRRCFDSIDIDQLQAALRQYVDDDAFQGLVERVLGPCSITSGWLRPRRQGLAQGSPLSPLLCNLYLHQVDEKLAEWSDGRGPFWFFRYADNILLAAGSRRLILAGLRVTRKRLAELGLSTRTRWWHCHRAESGFEWLGLKFVPRQRAWLKGTRFGCEVPEHKVLELIERIDEMTAPPSERIEAAAFDAARWISSLDPALRPWAAEYRSTLNAHEIFLDIDDYVFERVEQLLRTILGLSKSELRRGHLVRLPGGFRTWEVDGVRLAVLGLQRPQRYEQTVCKPAWMAPAEAAGTLASLPDPVAESTPRGAGGTAVAPVAAVDVEPEGLPDTPDPLPPFSRNTPAVIRYVPEQPGKRSAALPGRKHSQSSQTGVLEHADRGAEPDPSDRDGQLSQGGPTSNKSRSGGNRRKRNRRKDRQDRSSRNQQQQQQEPEKKDERDGSNQRSTTPAEGTGNTGCPPDRTREAKAD